MPEKKPLDMFKPTFGFDQTKNSGPASKTSNLDNAYAEWQTSQQPEQMTKLLEAAKPVISKALSSYAGNSKSLTGRAKLLAIDAFKSFDPKRGAKLQTHLYIRLQPLQRIYTQRTTPLATPERVQLDLLRLRREEQALKEQLLRDPSDDELAERLNLSTRRIAHVRKFSKGLVSEGQLRAPGGEPIMLGTQQQSPEDIWVEYVHHDLTPIDKKIFEWKTGIYGKSVLTTNEIARRLNITASAVSQRAQKIALLVERARNG